MLDHRGERLLGQPARLQEAGEVAPLAQLRDAQFDGAGAGFLQNAELFRLGVADTIITKRFNRNSVAQSYEYDHCSLAEDLDQINLPPGAERMGPRAQEAFRLISSGRASGKIVEEFLRIQREQGDDAAFD